MSGKAAALLLKCWFFLPAVLCICCGCVVQRGIDFGHWAQTGQNIPLVRFVVPEKPYLPAGIVSMAVLPALGEISAADLRIIDEHVLREAQLAFRAPLVTLEGDAKVAQYVTMENLLPLGNLWNSREIARLGQLLGVSHVLALRVLGWHPHQPQRLAMDFVIVETTAGTVVLQALATFDAREQQTVLALDRYLRSRSSRKYDRQNLDIILRSPREYSGFAVCQSIWSISEKLWPPRLPLKSTGVTTDNVTARN